MNNNLLPVPITVQFIRPGMRHRPGQNPKSSAYGKKMKATHTTAHEAWSTMTAAQLHAYVLTQRAADRPASWHLNIDAFYIGQSLPFDEPAFHAGDNTGPGNWGTIGYEMSDSPMRISKPDPELFWANVDMAARVNAWLYINKHVLLPYPEFLQGNPGFLAQHNKWSGKNCPAILRGMPTGWQDYVGLVGDYIKIGEHKELEPDQYYLLIAGSYTVKNNADAMQLRLAEAGFSSTVMPVMIGEVLFHRVVIGEYRYSEYQYALSLSNAIRAKGFSTNILELKIPKLVEIIEPEGPIEPEVPEEIIEKEELVEGVDPDLDRDWIDEHEEEFEGGKDPYEDVSGLLVLLRQLYEILKKLFGGD